MYARSEFNVFSYGPSIMFTYGPSLNELIWSEYHVNILGPSLRLQQKSEFNGLYIARVY